MASKWDLLKQELSGQPAAPAAPATNPAASTDKWGTLRQQLNIQPAAPDTKSQLQKAYPNTDFSKQTISAPKPNTPQIYEGGNSWESKAKAAVQTGASWLGSKIGQIPVAGDYLKATGSSIKESLGQMTERLGDAFEVWFAGIGGTKLSTYQEAPTSSPEARKKYIDEAPKVTGAELAGKTGLAALSVAMNVPNPVTGIVPVSVISSQIEAGKTLPGAASVPSKVVGKGFDILNTALGAAGAEFVNQTADALPIDDNQKNEIKTYLSPLAGETAAFFGTLGLIHSIAKGSKYAKQGITKLPVSEGLKTGLTRGAEATGAVANFGMSPVTTTFNLFQGKIFTKIQERQANGTPIDANESRKIISETVKEIPIEDTPEIKDVTDFARARLEELDTKAKGTEVYDPSTGKSRKVPGEFLTTQEINERNFLKNNTDPVKIAQTYGIPLEPVMKVGPVEIHTRQPLVLENLMRDREDLAYTKVDTLGKDLNGNPIAADFTWDYKNQKGTIRFTEDTTAEEISHELGHYVDHTAGAPNKARLTDLIPTVDENPAAVTRSLTGYIMSGRQRKPGDVAMQKAVIKTTKMINQAVDALTRGSDKYVSERFADAVREMIKSPEAQKKFPEFYDFVDYYLNSGRKDPITATVKKAGGKKAEKSGKKDTKDFEKVQEFARGKLKTKTKATIINPDIYKEMAQDFADANHGKYSQMAKEDFDTALKITKDPEVRFTGGGPGSGKSEIVLEDIVDGFEGIAYDGTLAKFDNVIEKVNKATKAGKKVSFWAIIPRVTSAWKFVQKRAILTGRDVPIEKVAEMHADFVQSLKQLVEAGYEVHLKDTRNIWKLSEAKTAPYIDNPKQVLAILGELGYTKDKLVSELQNVKLSKKSTRKALAARALEQKRLQESQRQGEQARAGASGGAAELARGQRASEGVKPTLKPEANLAMEQKAGFLLRQQAADFVAAKSVKLRSYDAVRNFREGNENTDEKRGGTWYATAESKTYDFTGGEKSERFVGGPNKLETKLNIKNPLTIKDAVVTDGSFSVINSGYEKYIPKEIAAIAEKLYTDVRETETTSDADRVMMDAMFDAGIPEMKARQAIDSKNKFDTAMDLIISEGLRQEGYDALILQNKNNKGEVIDEHIFKLAKEEKYRTQAELLTTRVLKAIGDKPMVKIETIKNQLNQQGVKQQEKNIILDALAAYEGKTEIPTAEFKKRVQEQLLPLKLNELKKAKYESISLPDDSRGNIVKYSEHVWESPIKTSAGDVHFGKAELNNYLSVLTEQEIKTYDRLSTAERYGEKLDQKDKQILSELKERIKNRGGVENYFGHTRIEDMAKSDTRRVIEVQSDLYQKGRLESEVKVRDLPIKPPNPGETFEGYTNERKKMIAVAREKRAAEMAKLNQYNDPTAHFRMVREEVAQAARDGKTKLQFPTGETAMKIEGLGTPERWTVVGKAGTMDEMLYAPDIKKGLRISDDTGRDWVITDDLGNGKFKAVTDDVWENHISGDYGKTNIESAKEEFDISGSVDTSNPIYKFYEQELGKYLRSRYQAKTITDEQGVTWNEVEIKPEMAGAVEAFRKAVPTSTNPENNDPIKIGDELGYKDWWKDISDNEQEGREIAKEFWSKTEQPGIYYHLSQEKISGKFDVTKTRYNPAARRGVSMINGMYLSTDPKAIKEFYGIDMESVTTKAYGNPRWLDLMDHGAETKFLSEVEEKYSVKDGTPEFGQAIAKELTTRGYDGIKYFDPWATGEEYVLVNTAKVSHKPGGEEPFRIKDDFASVGITISDKQEIEIMEINHKWFGDDKVKFMEQLLTREGQEAWGAYKEEIIRLLRGQVNAKDTYLHEAVHKTLDIFFTAEEHVDILMAGREKYKIDDWTQIEERIAEDFIGYVKTREGITGKLKLAFDQVILRIKRFLGNEDKVKALYTDIMSGQAAKNATRTEITPGEAPTTTSAPIAAPVPNQADKTTSKDSFEDFLSREFSNAKEEMPAPEEKISTKDEVIQRIMEQEYDAIKKTNQRKLMSDIKFLGGIKTDPTLREEMSTLPIDILRKNGVGPDEMVSMLQERGYQFDSVSDLFEAIESVRSMPSRYYVPKSNLQEKLAYLGKIKTQVAKANPDLATKIASLMKRMGTQVNKPRVVSQTKAKMTAGTGLDTGKRVSGPSYNPEKFNTSADVESLFKEISASGGEFSEQRISKSNEDIQRLSRMVNISVEDLLKTKPGSIANAETVRRAVELSMDCVQDLRDYTRTINEYSPTQEQLATVKKKLLRTMGVMKVVSGFRTEASNIFRSFNIDKTSSENAIIQETLVELKKIDAEAAGDLEVFAKKSKELMEPTTADKAWHLWYASILSGASTQVKNFAGNMFNLMGELAVQGVTNPRGFNDAAQGLWNGLALGKKEFKRIMREGQTNKFEERGVKPITFTLGAEKATGWQKTARERAAWVLNRADYVGRFMAATDAYFREGFQGMEMRSMAREQIAKKGYTGGELKQRIDEFVAHPDENAINQVMEYALRGTYNNKPSGVIGAIANGLGGIVRGIEKVGENAKEWKNPYLKYGTMAITTPAGVFARMVLPFTRVVANVTNVSLDWTPLGFGRATDPKMTSRARKQELGRAFMGTAAMFYLGNLAAQGLLSGTGPTDSKKKQQLKDAGWQPNAIKIGSQWYPYQNWGPMALPMTLVGNYYDHAKYNDAGESDLAARLTVATLGSARSIVDMSFLSGVSGLSSAMENLDRGGERYFQNFAAQQVSSVVPNLIKQTARYFDPTQYETTDIKSQILANMRITTGLKPRLNVFGQPIKGTALTQLQPTDVTKDATIRFLAENSLWITVPSKSTKIRPTKEFAKLPKGGRQMSEDEYYNYVKYSGIEIKKRLDKSLPRLEKMTSTARESEIKTITDDAREATKRGIEMGLIK